MGMIRKLLIIVILVILSASVISCEGCSQNNPTSPEKTGQQSS